MRRAARRAGVVRTSESDIVANAATVVLRHTEVGLMDPRGRVSAHQTRHVVPAEQVAPARTIEEITRDIFPQWTNADFFQQILGGLDEEEEKEADVRVRLAETLHPLLDFIPKRSEFLKEFLNLESPSGPLQCNGCSTVDAPSYYQCVECFDTRLFCQTCIVVLHARNPFHPVQQWNASFYICTDLQSLGLRIQLGHPVGQTCGSPGDVSKNDFVVLDTNGVHRVTIVYCACGTAEQPHLQLLRARLFPATSKTPQTAATFRLLHTFQLHSFLSKVSPYEYYSTLRRLSNNIGGDVPDRYKQFLIMIREWRHLKLLKRSGRGHILDGLSTVTPGQSAVICPACPHPGINLPPNYNLKKNNWLYRMFLAQDANFRLKRFSVSNATVDPSLNKGSAYIVSSDRYQPFLAHVSNNETVKEEKSDCNNHDAIRSASSKGKKGVVTTGIAAVECARHGMKRPTSVTTLQKGERYVNMDYAFFSSLSYNSPVQVVQSYDIACQWSKKVRIRLGEYFPWFDVDLFERHEMTFLVPKWHLAAHRDSCRTAFSFNFTPGVGRTDGEAPERGWAAINEIATSAKEMGPGSWSDSLDDYLADYNWRKKSIMHVSLLAKLVDAVPERADHVLAFLDFSKAIAKRRPDLVADWATLVQAWEADNTKTNPFVSTKDTLTLSDVRLQLAEEDSSRKEAMPLVHKDITPSKLLAFGLDIEDQQRRLAADWKALGTHPTPLQRSKLVERRNTLLRRISAWVDVQHLYIPALAAIRQEEDDHADANEPPIAETYDLHMPSSIAKKVTISPKMLEQEWKYRYAQAGATLDSLRGRLLLKGQMFKSKLKWSRGQGAHTRSNRLLESVQDKIHLDIDKYNDVRSRLLSLAAVLQKPGTWMTTYQVLRPEDVMGIDGKEDQPLVIHGQQPAKEQRTGEGRRKLSWIWKQAGVSKATIRAVGKSDAVNEILRIEWCKARARAHRWQEECQLIVEEMRRVKEYFLFEVAQWTQLAECNTTKPGHHAYALRQADICMQLYVRCTNNWVRVDEYLAMGAGGPEGEDNDEIRVEYVYNPEDFEKKDGESSSDSEDDGDDENGQDSEETGSESSEEDTGSDQKDQDSQ